MTLVTDILGSESNYTIATQQEENIALVNAETERINMKYENTENDVYNNQRLILFNQSFRDRQQKYIVVLVMFLIVFGICLAIVFMQERIGYDSFIMDILIKTIVSFGAITGIVMVNNIWQRDTINFSKLKQHGGVVTEVPASVPSNSAVTATALANDLAAGQISQAAGNTCKGAACCGPGYTYTIANNEGKCV